MLRLVAVDLPHDAAIALVMANDPTDDRAAVDYLIHAPAA
jgi:hypothetical protein